MAVVHLLLLDVEVRIRELVVELGIDQMYYEMHLKIVLQIRMA